MNDIAGQPVPDAGGMSEQSRDAMRVSRGLGIAAAVLSVPAVLVSVGAAVGFVVVAVLAAGALASTPGWLLLVLALAGIVAAGVFLVRVWVTRRAARDRAALAADLLGLVDLEEMATAVLADLAELSSAEGGLRAVSRARALWRLLRRLDVEEHTSQFERAKWFLPPEVGTTWALAQAVTWGGLVAWLLVPMVGGARATGWL